MRKSTKNKVDRLEKLLKQAAELNNELSYELEKDRFINHNGNKLDNNINGALSTARTLGREVLEEYLKDH